MTAQHEREGSEVPMTEQAEHLLDGLGERVGRSIASATRGVRKLTNGTNSDPDRPTMERAEGLVNQAELRIAGYTAMAAYSMRRVVARAKEEAEDIRAEAEGLRTADEARIEEVRIEEE